MCINVIPRARLPRLVFAAELVLAAAAAHRELLGGVVFRRAATPFHIGHSLIVGANQPHRGHALSMRRLLLLTAAARAKRPNAPRPPGSPWWIVRSAHAA